jgi:hypothetical protein
MMFRDSIAKIEEKRGHDFIVSRLFHARYYIERETGVRISDADFYAALAVAALESRDNVIQTFRGHLDLCPYQYVVPIIPLNGGIDRVSRLLPGVDEVYRRHGGTKRPPSKLHPLVQQDERDRMAVEDHDQRP